VAIWKCSECPHLERKELVPWGHYYLCSKFESKRDYSQSACDKMKGK
jgi:hypothetical protein